MPLKRVKFQIFAWVKSKKISKFMSFYRFLVVFHREKFCLDYGCTFGSAGAHTCPKSGEVAPPPRKALTIPSVDMVQKVNKIKTQIVAGNYGQRHKISSRKGGGVLGIIMTERCPNSGENTRRFRKKIILDTRFRNFDGTRQ